MNVALQGVSGAGLSTTVLPAASAGVIFERFSMKGKFHGVIAPTTPTGSCTTLRALFIPMNSCGGSSRSHSYRSMRSISHCMSSMHESCWTAYVSMIGAPTSVTI